MKLYNLILFIVLLPSISFADVSGAAYFGKYFESKYIDLEHRPVLYHTGIYLEFDVGDSLPILFLEDKSLIGGQTSTGFNPIQINYKIGLKKRIYNFEVLYQHECIHPVDGISNGNKAQGYNLIEIKYNF